MLAVCLRTLAESVAGILGYIMCSSRLNAVTTEDGTFQLRLLPMYERQLAIGRFRVYNSDCKRD